jgi:hypothetical protein
MQAYYYRGNNYSFNGDVKECFDVLVVGWSLTYRIIMYLKNISQMIMKFALQSFQVFNGFLET